MRIESRQARISYQDRHMFVRIESRQARVSYQDHPMLLLTLAGQRQFGTSAMQEYLMKYRGPSNLPPAIQRVLEYLSRYGIR